MNNIVSEFKKIESLIPESSQAFLSIGLTLICYFFARYLYLKLDKPILLQPMLIATSVLIFLVNLFDIPLNSFNQGTSSLTWMIAPLSIGLMVPLAENLKDIKRYLPAILFTLTTCGIFTVAVTLLIADLLNTSHLSLLSLASKSVTTPVALIISEEINALPSLAALIVIITGVIGVITAPLIFKIFRINDEKVKGITLGLSAHIIGTAYALEDTKKEGENGSGSTNTTNRYAAYSIVSMSLTALLSAFILPWIIPLVF